MPAPIFKLEEQLTDQRSEHIAYKLTIENTSTEAMRLLSVQPRVPAGARLLEITDTSLAETNARRAELIEELNLILKQYLWVISESFRQTWIEHQQNALKEILRFSRLIHLYAQMFFNQKRWEAQMKREFDSFSYKIASASDARSAYARWLSVTSDHEAVRTLFEAKTEQLEQVEAQMNEGDRPGLTTIEAGSYFTATYVIKFDRGLLEPRKYQVGFDATHALIDGSSARSVSTATNVQISPYPITLTIVAVISALLGVLVRVSLEGAKDPIANLMLLASSGQLLVGPIVALIFFNVYEYTSLGKGIAMSISWRSALLIGALCGLAQDRILAALKALIGIGA